jgi:hypothetical protein
MPTTLGDRLAKHARQKARLEERERLLKEQERKARTRTLISMGGLIEKAGLSKLDQDALYGALMTLERGVSEEATVKRWRKVGRDALSGKFAAPDHSPDATEEIPSSDDAPAAAFHVVSQAG